MMPHPERRLMMPKSQTVSSFIRRDWVEVATDLIFYAVELCGAMAFIALCGVLWIVTP